MKEIVFAFFPILLLIWLMVKKNGMPSARALPFSALVVYLVVLIVFEMNPVAVHANVIKGLLLAWTPILIIAGAIFLFKTLERTGGLSVLRMWLNSVTSNKVAQLMIVGWAFPFLIEGASGFGTPAAIAAPILVGLGFPPVRVAILTLIMNSVPVSFGAIGTPTWFGFSELTLSESEVLVISFKTAILNAAASIVIPAIALIFILKTRTVLKNYLFIFLSTLLTVFPYIIIARYNYEFPALIGGIFGLIATVILARKGIGLSKSLPELREAMTSETSDIFKETKNDVSPPPGLKRLLAASFPLWGTVLVLVITRIPALGIKGLLTSGIELVTVSLGSLGDLSLSRSLVLGLNNILGTSENWTHSLLFVPSLIPFGLVSIVAVYFSGKGSKTLKSIFNETVNQMVKPTYALLGALVFVSLMMMNGEESLVSLMGEKMAAVTGDSWQLFASFLGGLGSFFSGSATISNLTFGGIQDSIAQTLSLDRTTILALQSAGASMGNMVCINNIVAVASVLALGNVEGAILKKTVLAMLAYGVIISLVGLIF